MKEVFIDTVVLFFIGTLILILFFIGAIIKKPPPPLFWIVPGLFYIIGLARFVFWYFFKERVSKFK